MDPLTKRAIDVFNPVDGAGHARGANMGECQTWGSEIEALLALAGLALSPLVVTEAGSVTIPDNVTRVEVKLDTPGVVNFTIGLAADRKPRPCTIADLDGIFADHPATVTRSGSDTFQASDGGATSVTLDSAGMVTTFYPTADEDGYFRG